MPQTFPEGGAMANRDEYVEKLKRQLDQWNAQVTQWEGQVRQAQGRMRQKYAPQLEVLKNRRDQAWKGMQDAFERARSRFDRK
jgi:hypothetical protein